MRNTKEIQTILSAIYCINLSKRDKRDKNIELLCGYAFNRLFNGSPNLLILSCAGKSEEQILEEVNQMMYADTKYKSYVDWKNFQEEQRKKENETKNIWL